jgi:hypothetical protein
MFAGLLRFDAGLVDYFGPLVGFSRNKLTEFFGRHWRGNATKIRKARPWTWDTYAFASSSAKLIVQQGGDSWFFVTADFAFGHAMQRDARVTRRLGQLTRVTAHS